jgi:hypothetical protein
MTLSGSNITQMTDRSPAARHISSTTATDPTYASNTVEITRSSNKAFDTWASALPSALFDYFWVGDLTTVSGAGHVILTDLNREYAVWQPDGIIYYWDGGANRTGPSWGSTVGVRQGLIRMKTTTDFSASVNGGTPTAFSLPGGANPGVGTTPVIGNKNTGTFTGFGNKNEWLILPANTSDATVAKVQGYLAWKWDPILSSGLVAALPSGHAHKSAAPTL